MDPQETINKIKVVGVIGAGGMDNQIAEIMARAGYTGRPGKKGIYDFYRDVLSK